MFKKIGLIITCLLFLTLVSHAQTSDECAKMKYEDYNKTALAQVTVKNIVGTVMLQDNKHIRVSSCVGIYEEKTKKLVRVVYLELKQKFDIRGIPDGEYRLVVKEKDGFFCTANVPVKVDQSIPVKTIIAVELKRPSAETCTYDDLKT